MVRYITYSVPCDVAEDVIVRTAELSSCERSEEEEVKGENRRNGRI